MMKYQIVEKDIENKKGFLHEEIYDNLQKAEYDLKELEIKFGTEYYDFFIIVIEQSF